MPTPPPTPKRPRGRPPTPKRPRGRPPLPEGTAASIRVDVYLTPAQTEKLDTDRGDTPRSVWLRERAGLR